MRYRVVPVLVLLMATASAVAQEQRQVFLSVSVPAGAPAISLQPSDVVLTEDGVDCKVVKVEPIGWPMKLTLLIDNGTHATDYLGDLRNGLKRLLTALPADVEVSLVTLAPQPRIVVKPTTDRAQLFRGVDLFSPDSADGQFFQALVDAGDTIAAEKDVFPVIVVFTTDLGGGRALDQQFNRLRVQVAEHAATVHFILLSSVASPSSIGPAARPQPGQLTPLGPANRARPGQPTPRTPPPNPENAPQELGFVQGGLQRQVGLTLTKLTGGRYEGIAAVSRLDTLLPELGAQIARSDVRQHQNVRITYEPPPGARQPPKSIAARVARDDATIALSLDGHLP